MLSGMIIGVGMFGIPFAFAHAGFWLGLLELGVLAAVVTTLHLLYGEIVLGTPGPHRLPGYVKLYLGKKAAFIGQLSALGGISLTLLAYVLLGSIFLRVLLQNVLSFFNETIFAVILMAGGAFINFFPLKKEAFINGVLTAFLIAFIVVLVIMLFPRVQEINLAGFELRNILLPYGILLFALSGGTVIPDVIAVAGKKKNVARAAILVGTLVPAVLYVLFAFTVMGVSGQGVSSDAIQGLGVAMGSNTVLLASIIGFLAVFTSYIVLNSNFQAMLHFDFGFSEHKAWFVASLVPPLLYIAGFRDFFAIIGVVGAVAVGIDSALVLAAHHCMLREKGRALFLSSYVWRGLIYAMILIGIGYEVMNL